MYHLKHGLSKQVFSSSGFSLAPHANSSKVWNFPPVMPTHRTVLRLTPRPQVVLHCKNRALSASLRSSFSVRSSVKVCASRWLKRLSALCSGGPHPLPLLAQPVRCTVPLPTGVECQRLVLGGTLVLRNHATLRCLAVHVTHHLALAARPRAL